LLKNYLFPKKLAPELIYLFGVAGIAFSKMAIQAFPPSYLEETSYAYAYLMNPTAELVCGT